MTEKLQKVLANAGYGSRRQIEEWIKEGRIMINGRPAQLGDRITVQDKIRLNNKAINLSGKTPDKIRVVLYHKPEGEVCSRSDPEGRPSVFKNLPEIKQGRWVNIGRLDINTSGLLMFSNDGDLVNQLTHPSNEVEREYAVRVLGKVTPEMIENMTKGIMLDDGMAKFDSIRDAGGKGANHWYHVVLHEGRNREVRRLWESQGITISRLIRVRFGNISLPSRLRAGKWEEMKEQEINKLRESLKKED